MLAMYLTLKNLIGLTSACMIQQRHWKFIFLDVQKATGLDVISPQFLKNEAPIICAPLAAFFNNSMLKGKIPQSWKNTKVTPIFKAGDLTDVSNYRPNICNSCDNEDF